ncbi:MAG: regulatory protein RecX [Salinibacterium sp.]|nr:MAG: regulatory protein RecX [Salinibacterium sp.]
MEHEGGQQTDHLAPVTYLFGAEPASALPSTALSSSASPDSRAASRADGFAAVSTSSMHALARRGMSSHEMRDYLIGREYDEQTVNEEIERLEGAGLLDDAHLAETLVRTLRDRKGLGRSGVTSELRRRHLDGAAIEAAVDALGDDELERAVAVAAKRAPQLASLDAPTARRRLSAFLMRRGYSGSVVSTAVARALGPTGPVFR